MGAVTLVSPLRSVGAFYTQNTGSIKEHHLKSFKAETTERDYIIKWSNHQYAIIHLFHNERAFFWFRKVIRRSTVLFFKKERGQPPPLKFFPLPTSFRQCWESNPYLDRGINIWRVSRPIHTVPSVAALLRLHTLFLHKQFFLVWTRHTELLL